MAKAPRLGNLYRYFPKWWHQVEPNSVTMESFQPTPNSPGDEEQSRFQKLAEIALHESGKSKKPAA